MSSESAPFTKADLIAAFFADNGVPAVFELSGGMIAFLTDAVARLGKTPIINTRHKQAAGFAAEGATRVSGRSAAAMGTSGPGATNLITAIASSYFDSVPFALWSRKIENSYPRGSRFVAQIARMLRMLQGVSSPVKYRGRIGFTFE